MVWRVAPRQLQVKGRAIFLASEAQRRPPCSSTMVRQSDRPRPVPVDLVVKKASKICAHFLGCDAGASVADLEQHVFSSAAAERIAMRRGRLRDRIQGFDRVGEEVDRAPAASELGWRGPAVSASSSASCSETLLAAISLSRGRGLANQLVQAEFGCCPGALCERRADAFDDVESATARHQLRLAVP